MTSLLTQLLSIVDDGQTVAVCTLVGTRGSTPQKTGAIMLVLQNGRTIGTIGGGCVEAEVRSHALGLLVNPADRLLSFKLDHDLGWDDGLICGGTMDVAVQIISNPAQAMHFRQLRHQLAGAVAANLSIVVQDAQEQRRTFTLGFESPPSLVIAGAGHVGEALANIARTMEFNLVVIDDRPDMASPERFPGAALRIGPIEDELKRLELNENSYVVIVTRGHRRDAAALAAVVNSPAAYIGLIGSRRKIVKIFSEMQERGVSAACLRKIHAPIGLDIGAVTPAEIAVSVSAQLIAIRRKHTLRAPTSMALGNSFLYRADRPSSASEQASTGET